MRHPNIKPPPRQLLDRTGDVDRQRELAALEAFIAAKGVKRLPPEVHASGRRTFIKQQAQVDPSW